MKLLRGLLTGPRRAETGSSVRPSGSSAPIAAACEHLLPLRLGCFGCRARTAGRKWETKVSSGTARNVVKRRVANIGVIGRLQGNLEEGMK
jgi:hypothetical protein